jgi:streptogramin lyase
MNYYGQLGNGISGYPATSSTPVQVGDLTDIRAIQGAAYSSVAHKKDGSVWAWGNNAGGQLGNGISGDNALSSTPVHVIGTTDVVLIAGGDAAHSLAVKKDGSVWGWGWNGYGQLGETGSDTVSSPTLVNGISDVVAVAVGAIHSLAIKKDGTVWAWGVNFYGQLGTELGRWNYIGITTPVQVSGF